MRPADTHEHYGIVMEITKSDTTAMSPGPWMSAVIAEMAEVPTAVRTFDEDWSGPELLARAGGAARYLERLAPPETIVPALLANSPSSIALTLGGALVNRPLAPLGTRLAVSELATLLAGIGTQVVIADQPNLELAGWAAGRSRHTRLPRARTPRGRPRLRADPAGQRGTGAAYLRNDRPAQGGPGTGFRGVASGSGLSIWHGAVAWRSVLQHRRISPYGWCRNAVRGRGVRLRCGVLPAVL